MESGSSKTDLKDKTVMKEVAQSMDDTRASIALLDTMALFKSKNANVNTIAKAIGFDPAISDQILREVNSPHYSLPNRVKELPHAISLIGFKRTQEIVMTTTKHDMYEQVENSYFELLAFKKHGLAVGCFAEQLAMHLKLQEPKEFFKAGSLHDIGKYFYLNRAPAQFETLVKQSREEKIPLYQIERTHLKTDHAEIGSMMAHQWKLPEPICVAIRYHHECPDKVKDRLTSRETQMVQVVSYANLLAHGHKDAGVSTGRRVSIKDLPPPPGILNDEDLAKIIVRAEAQFKDECEASGLTSAG